MAVHDGGNSSAFFCEQLQQHGVDIKQHDYRLFGRLSAKYFKGAKEVTTVL